MNWKVGQGWISVVQVTHSKRLQSIKSIVIDCESIEDRLIDSSTLWISSLRLNVPLSPAVVPGCDRQQVVVQ